MIGKRSRALDIGGKVGVYIVFPGVAAALLGIYLTGAFIAEPIQPPVDPAVAATGRNVKDVESRARQAKANQELLVWMKQTFLESSQRRDLLVATDKALEEGRVSDVFELLQPVRVKLDPVMEERYVAARKAVLDATDNELTEGKFDQVFDRLRPRDGLMDALLQERYTAAAQGIIDADTKRAWAGAEARAKAKTEAEAADVENVLQRWECSGMLRSIDIWSITGTTAKRRVRMIYDYGVITTDEYVETTKAGDRTTYRTDPERNDFFVVSGNIRLTFFENGRPMSDDDFSACIRKK